MRRAGLLAALPTALGCLVSVGPLAAPAAACSCAGTTDQRAVARADAAFVGTVVRRADLPRPAPGPPNAPTALAFTVLTFAVADVLKGEVAPGQQVLTSRSGASCGIGLPQGARALVIGRTSAGSGEPVPGPGQLLADLCGGSRVLGPAETADDLPRGPVTTPSALVAATGGATPARTPTPGPAEPKGVDGPLALLTLATVGGVVGFLLIVRRHKRRMRAARRRAPRRS